MTRCCSNIFLNQFTQQPPDVIVDPPGASLCYHYEDVDLGQFDLVTSLVMDKVTVNGVDTAIGHEVMFVDWAFDFLQFNYGQVVTDLAAVSVTAGVIGMGFFINLTPGGNLGFRFSMVADGLTAHSLTYTVDRGSGPEQFTVDLTGQNCDVAYGCYEATYTPEAPFLIEFGNIQAVTNQGLTLFETQFFPPACTEIGDVPDFLNSFQAYVQTLHGGQSSVTIDVVGNTATVKIFNTLLVPIHMDNQGDSGCVAPQSLPQVNPFTAIDCP